MVPAFTQSASVALPAFVAAPMTSEAAGDIRVRLSGATADCVDDRTALPGRTGIQAQTGAWQSEPVDAQRAARLQQNVRIQTEHRNSVRRRGTNRCVTDILQVICDASALVVAVD